MSEAEKHQSPIAHRAADEPYIYDAFAASNLAVKLKDASDAAMLCEGEKYFCEYCGTESPMWPPRGWAGHVVTAHRDTLTIQTSGMFANLCTDELSPLVQQWLMLQFMSRVSMRRRARELNMIVFGEKRIVDA
jgi:hypothetical protein